MRLFLALTFLLLGATSYAKGFERNVVIESMGVEDDGNIYSYSVWVDASGNQLGLKNQGKNENAVAHIQYRLVPATTEIEQDLTRNSNLTVRGSLINKESDGKSIVETILVREVIKN